jgi:putative membrane protein
MLIAFGGMAACNGDSNTPPPQTPADQTTTTGADSPNQYGQPAQPGVPDPSTAPSSATGSGPSVNGGATPSSTPNPIDATALGDAQIVAVVQAADTGEMAQAREAISKAKNGRVKHFAQHMLTDHSAAETKLTRLDAKQGITPQTSAVAERIKADGQEVSSSLKSASASEFDKTYIDAQVKEHTSVLDCLDTKLIPRAQSPELAKTLQDIRSKVADHLKEAQDIQSSLEGNQNK